MATRGRKPKPTALKELEGNPGHRPLNERAPKPPKKAPACPKDLSPEGKKEWRRLCKEMEQAGVLTNWDMRIFEQYCDAYARWKEATDFLNERGLFFITPSGYPQQFPQVAIAQNYSKLMHKYAQELGLTPAARSRLIAGTGAEDKDEICYELHMKALDIMAGRKIDHTFYPVVYGLTDDDDWMDEENWYKANPSLGQTIQIDRVRDMFREAIDNPAEENVFKQLRLNMWVSSLTRFIPEQIYDLGNIPIDMEALKDRDCYGGLDLSSTGDITAFVLMFPPRTEDEKYIMLPFFWIPEDTIPLRVRRASVPYDVWHQQGYINATEGNVIHYGFIEKFIEKLGEQYHILKIAFDRWGATQMVQDLEGMGFTVVPFGQGYKDMSPPTKEFYKLLMEGRIIHGGNPVMRWMAGNVVVDRDPAENIKPTKAKSPEKIDGIVAAIMALDRCIRHEEQGSVYDDPEHGLWAF